MRSGNLNKQCLALAVAACCYHNVAHSGGFGITTVNGAGAGLSYSANAATTGDASVAYTNPAALATVPTRTLSAGTAVLLPSSTYEDKGSTHPASLGMGSTGGTSSFELDDPSVTPFAFYAAPLNDKYSYGVAVNAPFGTHTDYPDDWSGRYQADETYLRVIGVAPGIAMRIDDKLSVGAAISIQRSDAILSSAINNSAACLRVVSGGAQAAGQDAAAAGATAIAQCAGVSSNDSKVEIEGDGVAVGATLGVLYQPDANNTVGVTFRAPVTHELEGKADYTLDTTLSGAINGAALNDGDVTTSLNMPASLSFSASHQTDEKTRVYGDITWTGWSSMEALEVKNADGSTLSKTDLSWNDTTRFSAGLEYALNDQTTLKFGAGFDPTPSPDAQHRTPRAPSEDAYWLSVGARHQINEKMDVDVGYMRIQLDQIAIDHQDTSGYTTRGTVDSSVNALGVQLNYRF